MADKDFLSTVYETLITVPTYKFALREDLKDDKRFLPTRGEEKATGWDVRAAFPDTDKIIVHPFEQVKIPLGIRGLCPDGWWYEIRPRSSSFAKKNLHALYGVVDETYEGELIFACQYIPVLRVLDFQSGLEIFGAFERWTHLPELTINFGDAVGQIVPVKRQEMNVMEINNTTLEAEYASRNGKRGAGGFGSTGK